MGKVAKAYDVMNVAAAEVANLLAGHPEMIDEKHRFAPEFRRLLAAFLQREAEFDAAVNASKEEAA